jgi:hypothetical protein
MYIGGEIFHRMDLGMDRTPGGLPRLSTPWQDGNASIGWRCSPGGDFFRPLHGPGDIRCTLSPENRSDEYRQNPSRILRGIRCIGHPLPFRGKPGYRPRPSIRLSRGESDIRSKASVGRLSLRGLLQDAGLPARANPGCPAPPRCGSLHKPVPRRIAEDFRGGRNYCRKKHFAGYGKGSIFPARRFPVPARRKTREAQPGKEEKSKTGGS